VIEDLSSWQQLDRSKLLKGDVIAFNGMHVAAYVGDGHFMDSDPIHEGVGPMKYHPNDPWFTGRVKVLRWNSSHPAQPDPGLRFEPIRTLLKYL